MLAYLAKCCVECDVIKKVLKVVIYSLRSLLMSLTKQKNIECVD